MKLVKPLILGVLCAISMQTEAAEKPKIVPLFADNAGFAESK